MARPDRPCALSPLRRSQRPPQHKVGELMSRSPGVILTATIEGATLQYAGLPLALFDGVVLGSPPWAVLKPWWNLLLGSVPVGRLDWLALGGKWRRARLHTVE